MGQNLNLNSLNSERAHCTTKPTEPRWIEKESRLGDSRSPSFVTHVRDCGTIEVLKRLLTAFRIWHSVALDLDFVTDLVTTSRKNSSLIHIKLMEMEDEPPASVFAQKLQKDIANIGTSGVFKVSLKIFENHTKSLITPVSQVLALLNTVVLSVWALVLLLYLDHDLPLPAGVQIQTILLASSVRIDEESAPIFAVLVIMLNFGFLSVILSIWQSQFTRVVGRIYTAESISRVSSYPFKELLITEAWTCPLLLAAFMAFAVSVRSLAMCLHPILNWTTLPVAFFASLASGAVLMGAILVSQLTTVVCLMANCCQEELYGRAAVRKAAVVLKGRWGVGLGLAGIYGGAMLLMGSNLLRPGFSAGFGTRLLFSSFQIFLFSIWRQLAYLCWVVFYVSCRAFQQDYIGGIQPDGEKAGSESKGSAV